MIVATLGHVDHGKTALVRALTGVEGDRLPEEKARGMTVDLGFAYWRTEAGLTGFVDVPGHERFLRNMLAGVAGIDFVLLVVAADDGVMPQTREHLAIADLLGLGRGAIVLTKVDRVEPERVREVAAQVRALVTGTALQDAPMFPVSSLRGDGMPALRRFLQEQLLRTPVHAGEGPARLAIDRAFSVKGTGTVVTGTVFDGCIRVGDELVLSPAGVTVRVRRVRIHDADAAQAVRGQRCALAIAGSGLDVAARGQWLLSASLHRATDRVDCRLRVLPAAAQALRHGQTVQVHAGTGSVRGRILACSAQREIVPGAEALVTLKLEQPMCVQRGDRFVLRDDAHGRAVGGGLVLDPFASPARTSAESRARRLRALAAASVDGVLRALADDEPGCVDLAWLAAVFRLDGEACARAIEDAGLLAIGTPARFALARARLDALSGQLMAVLAGQAAATGHGIDTASLARAVAPTMPPACFGAVLAHVAGQGRIRFDGHRVRRAGRLAWDERSESLWRRVHPKLLKAAHLPERLPEIARRMDVDEGELEAVLRRKHADGELLRVGPERFLLREMLPRLVRMASDLARSQAQQSFSAAEFRDAIGCGRALAIDLLDCLDRLRLTRRIGDLREVRPGASEAAAVRPGSTRERRQNWRHRHRFGGRGVAHE